VSLGVHVLRVSTRGGAPGVVFGEGFLPLPAPGDDDQALHLARHLTIAVFKAARHLPGDKGRSRRRPEFWPEVGAAACGHGESALDVGHVAEQRFRLDEHELVQKLLLDARGLGEAPAGVGGKVVAIPKEEIVFSLDAQSPTAPGSRRRASLYAPSSERSTASTPASS
jgi:hypothetical protein